MSAHLSHSTNINRHSPGMNVDIVMVGGRDISRTARGPVAGPVTQFAGPRTQTELLSPAVDNAGLAPVKPLSKSL